MINAKIRNGDSINGLYKLTGLSRNVLTKHKNECMSKIIATDSKSRDALVGDTLLKQVRDQIELVQKLVIACDEWLTDPDDPEKYFLGPRGQEIDITYSEIDPDTGRILPSQRKATLQEMIQAVESKGYVIRGITNKHSDPRELLLKAIGKLEGTAKFIYESSQKLIEWEHKKKALDKLETEGGSISFEKQVEMITEKVTIAYNKGQSQELSELAGLPDLTE
jgi:hypothetical protein